MIEVRVTAFYTFHRRFPAGVAMFRCLALFLITICTVLFLTGKADAADIFLTGGGGEYHNIRTSTFADIPFRNVIRQRFDYSCGSAALATLLTYHYDVPVSEMTVLQQMFEHGDQEKIRKEGFSLLDMKQYLATIGLKAEGFREPLEKLTRVGIPAIVLLNINGYLHFVVVKGMRDNEVLTGDPALGMKIIPRKEFDQMWNGILFVITNKIQVARQNFNHDRYWAFRPKAPFDREIQLPNQHLGTIALDMVRTPGYY